MATGRRKTPDFFNEDGFDPVNSATGYRQRFSDSEKIPASGSDIRTDPAAGPAVKKKAGFYLSVQILERFTRKFHELKLAGFAINNKSALLELALSFALDDLDKGSESRVLQHLLKE